MRTAPASRSGSGRASSRRGPRVMITRTRRRRRPTRALKSGAYDYIPSVRRRGAEARRRRASRQAPLRRERAAPEDREDRAARRGASRRCRRSSTRGAGWQTTSTVLSPASRARAGMIAAITSSARASAFISITAAPCRKTSSSRSFSAREGRVQPAPSRRRRALPRGRRGTLFSTSWRDVGHDAGEALRALQSGSSARRRKRGGAID